MFRSILFLSLFSLSLCGQEFPKTVFQDDFNGKELNKRWLFYISESIQKEGNLVCMMPKGASHGSVNYFRYEPSADFELSLKFKFEGDAKYLGVIFNDKKYKGSHAGHICNVHITPKNIQLREGKTGVFDLKIRKMLKSKSLDQKTKELLRKKETNVKQSLNKGQWYKLCIRISGSEMTCEIDGKLVSKLHSGGISHKTKNFIGLSVWGQSVHIDDFVLKTK